MNHRDLRSRNVRCTWPLATLAAAAALTLASVCAAQPAAGAPAAPTAAAPATAAAQPKEGWYPKRVEFEQVRALVDIPPRKGVAVIDSRPAARRYDDGHIPGAINIPDSHFDKMTDRLPADKAARLVFYCGGYDCMLSHNSAFKAEKLGYQHIEVYAAGLPDWTARGGHSAVSGAYIQKLMADKTPFTLIDARPRRTADKGMIPGAINIPDTEFDKSVAQLPPDKSALIIYYCGGLECPLSEKSAAKARALGYTQVFTYAEGYPQWQAMHAAPAATAAPAAAAAPAPAAVLVAGKEKGSATVASFQQVWRDKPASLLLVDVRDAKEFAGGSARGAINLPINDLEKKVGTLPTDKPVVFVCGTGARAGEAYDTVKLLRPEVQAYFLDANVRFENDGQLTISDKK